MIVVGVFTCYDCTIVILHPKEHDAASGFLYKPFKKTPLRKSLRNFKGKPCLHCTSILDVFTSAQV